MFILTKVGQFWVKFDLLDKAFLIVSILPKQLQQIHPFLILLSLLIFYCKLVSAGARADRNREWGFCVQGGVLSEDNVSVESGARDITGRGFHSDCCVAGRGVG